MEQVKRINKTCQWLVKGFRNIRKRRNIPIVVLLVLLLTPILVRAVDVSLEKGFNLFSYPVEPPIDLTCTQFQTQTGADRLSRLNPFTQQFEPCGACPVDFFIFAGEGYVLDMPSVALLQLNGQTSCPLVDLIQGMNLIGVPSPAPGMGCFELLNTIGDDQTVASVQRFNPRNGKTESCAYDHLGLSATPVGSDFPITPGEAYWVSMLRPQNAVALNDPVQCPPVINPPVIRGFTPQSGPVGTLVTITGDQFSPTPPLAPQVTMPQRGGGTIRVPIARFDNTQIEVVIPTGADTGPFTVTVGTQSVTSTQPFTVTPPSSFTLSAAPANADLIQGQSVNYSLTLDSADGFSQLAELSVQGLPAGITATFKPSMIAAGQQSLLTLSADANQPLSVHNLTVNADAQVGGIDVNAVANLSVAVQPVTTTFMGQAVLSDAQQIPLAGVTITFLGVDNAGNPTNCSGQTVTDAAGNFSFTNLPPECSGSQLIRYDGLTVSNLPGEYAGVALGYNIVGGQVNTPPVQIRLSRIDDKETVLIKQNWPQDQTFTFASIPNLEVTVYAGTTFTMPDGSQPDPFPLIALDVPLDRLPGQLPPRTDQVMPFMVAFQPAGAKASQPFPVSFPNVLGQAPGTTSDLATLDPIQGRIVDYGTGTVSLDGTKIVPDFDPTRPGKRYGLLYFDWHGPWGVGPPPGPPPEGPPVYCPTAQSDSPVDYSSGVEVITVTDIALNGLRGSISLQRTYRTVSLEAGPFGIGSNHNYGYRLDTNAPQHATVINLVMPNGTRFPFNKIGNQFSNSMVPSLAGAVMTVLPNGQVPLRWRNGTVFNFVPSTAVLGSVLESIIDANGNRIQLIRNPSNDAQITDIIDPVGRKLVFTYDTANRITSVTDPEGGVTRYDYSARDRLTQVTDARGVVIVQNTYDTDGRVIEQLYPDGGVLKIDFQLLNPNLGIRSPVQQTTVTDPLGNVTVYRYNPQGALIDVTDPLRQIRVYRRDQGINQILSITGTGSCTACGNPASGDRFFTYDAKGNLLTETDALGNQTTYTYEPVFNKVASITDALGGVSQFQYDNAGNLISSIDQNGNTTTYKYDNFGLPIEITDPAVSVTSFRYDSLGNRVETVDPLGNRSFSTYDAVGRVVDSIDALGNKTINTYDKLGRIVTTTDALGRTTQMTFDEVGNLLSLTDARNNPVSFTYDVMNRVDTRTDSNGKIETRTYDLNGNLKTFTDRRGQTSNFSYDTLNRIVQESYEDGSIVDWLYDAQGLLVQVDDTVGGVFSFNYDAAGRLLNTSGPVGGVDYTRDALGRVVQRQVLGQNPVDYQFDPVGNLLSASTPQAAITAAYDQRNQMTSQTRANGVVTTFGYDNAGRLTTIDHAKTATTFESLTYIRDAVGNIIGKSSVNPAPFVTQPAVFQIENNSNRLLQRGNVVYTHDDNGNRVTETGPQGVTNYTWDARNRLAGISLPGGTTHNFRYDFAGNMIEQTTQGPGVNETKRFVLDDLTNVAYEENSNGRQVSTLTGRTIDQHLAEIDANGGGEYVLTDLTNSTVATVDENGAKVGGFDYEPFGETQGSGSIIPYQFTGRVPVMTDFYYYRARFYDPLVGRFGSEYPIGFYSGDTNLYRYVFNNTINLFDPFGLCASNSTNGCG